jgi:hypothetical protein
LARERLGDGYDLEHSSGTGITLEQAVADPRARLPR